MSNGDIAPPQEQLTTDGKYIQPSWYRYLVQRKKITDGITESVVVTFGDERTLYPNSKALTVVSGQLTETDNGPMLELGLADTAVTPATYGAADRIVVLTIDQKGRITAAAEIILNSDNVHEGTTNLFYTDARARAALSGGSGINYNSGTGAIATAGFSGGPALYTSLTFVNGICTAAS